MARWLLPENIADMLPREAARVERLRRALVDLYRVRGFELVRPPLIEYVDSLLTGTGSDLDLRTFKLIDQASGRMLGLRADMTPQAARIDAHILNRAGVTRLCYAGPVLHARPLHPLASREPYVAGAELFGHSGREADAEILKLAVASLRTAGVQRVHLDIGHTAVVRAIIDSDPLAQAMRADIYAALAAKDRSALDEAAVAVTPATRAALGVLMGLYGSLEVIERARRELPALPALLAALDQVEWLADCCGADETSFDFTDVHGYEYLTGVTFSAHVPQLASAVLRGGRYDDIGCAFGRSRPATGFTVYLRELALLGHGGLPKAVVAPVGDEPELELGVAKLRALGEIVVQLLPGETVEGLADSFEFDRELVPSADGWVLVTRQ
ncbi:MAG: ATP phosphoribosyltransferase regulatory subunit [Burkholderiaceae bacterium]